MRLVKVRIRAGDTSIGDDQLVYPTRYDAKEVDRYGFYATKLNVAAVSMSGDIGRGGDEEYCVIALPDALAEEYADDPNMMLIDSIEADTLMESWRVKNGAPKEVVTDSARIDLIRAKRDNQITLTQEDLDALDVNKDTPGVNSSRTPIKNKVERMGQVVNDDLVSLPPNKKVITKKIR